MQKFIVFLAVCLAAVLALPYDLVENEEGEQFVLMPLVRNRRESEFKGDIAKKEHQGIQVTLANKGTIFDNGKHEITGTPFVSKQFDPKGPTTLGGTVGYTYQPKDLKLEVTGAHTKPFGNTLDVRGTATLWKFRDARLDAYADWTRNYGGLYGTSHPEASAGLVFTKPIG